MSIRYDVEIATRLMDQEAGDPYREDAAQEHATLRRIHKRLLSLPIQNGAALRVIEAELLNLEAYLGW